MVDLSDNDSHTSFAGEMTLDGIWKSFQSSSPDLFDFLKKYNNLSYNQWPGSEYASSFKECIASRKAVVFHILFYTGTTLRHFLIHLFPGKEHFHCSGVEFTQQLRYLADKTTSIDRITGMRTKSLFFPQLESQIKLSKRYSQPLSLIILRYRELKNKDNPFSKKQTEKTLSRMSSIIRNEIRESDLVYRYSKSDFNIILPHTDKKGSDIRKSSFNEIFMDQFADTEFNVTTGSSVFDPKDPLITDDMDLSQRVLQDALNDLEYGT